MSHRLDGKRHDHGDGCCRRGMNRRGFLASVGAGVAGMAAADRIFAAGSGGPEARVEKPGGLTRVSLDVNGRRYVHLVEPRWSLLYVLREVIGLTAAKEGCGRGECGACTVLIDDIPRYACMTLAVEAEGSAVTTLEGLMDGEALGPVQQAFAESDAYQCGYCTPGQIMSVEGLLRADPDPSLEDIRQAVSGNLCRCGAYVNIFEAARLAAKRRRKG